jgi:hypothetical protein
MRYLVVANQTLGGAALRAAIEARRAAGPAAFHVVVPATPSHDVFREATNAYAGSLPDDHDADAEARRRLDLVLDWLREAGTTVSGHVGSPDPFHAIEAALAQDSYDEIILSTLPPGASKWLALDLPHRVQRSTPVPVCQVVGAAPSGS